jgi:LmbE family N-acetylglucosaminyl deacetylase
MPKLLAIFAHPDDEGVVAGTLSHYAQQGTEVTLICATKGEVGEISDPALATPETLGTVREAELRAAGDILGLREVYFLGYRDSGMVDTPQNDDPRSLVQADSEEATGRLVALMRRLQPEVVITFEPFGWYGHPDHQAVSRLVTAAYHLLPDETAYPEAGQPWQPHRLFYSVMPISKFKIMVEYAQAHGLTDFEGFADLPEELMQATESQVTHVLDIRELVETKFTAMEAHHTQFGEDNWFRKIPLEITRQTWGYEYFIQVDPPPSDGLREAHATDLLD